MMHRMERTAKLAIATAIAAMLGTSPAFAQRPQTGRPAPATAPAAPTTTDAGYILGPGDVVEVQVVGREDFRNRVRVQQDGAILLPLVGRMPATGRTSLQLAEDVRRALRSGGYYSDPQVSVDIASYASRYITVLGEVGQPGLVPIDRAYRVSEILARVGGVKETGSDEVTLSRGEGEQLKLSVRTLATGGGAEDPLVNAGDKLFVATAPTFFIYGQVAAPGSYRLDPDLTLRKALARGGGLTPSGSDKRVKVFRDGEEIKKFDLNQTLTPGDVVVVGERLF